MFNQWGHFKRFSSPAKIFTCKLCHRQIGCQISLSRHFLHALFFTDKEQEEKTLQSITAARKKVKAEIQELSDKLKQSKETKQKLRDELAKLEDKY